MSKAQVKKGSIIKAILFNNNPGNYIIGEVLEVYRTAGTYHVQVTKRFQNGKNITGKYGDEGTTWIPMQGLQGDDNKENPRITVIS